MRKMDHTKAYSPEDIAFLRQMGVPYAEDWIRQNAETHGYDPDQPNTPDDTLTKPVIGPEGAVGNGAPVIDPATGAPRLVDPTNPEATIGSAESESNMDDDYDRWKMPELQADVAARNEMPDTTQVEVIGTGQNGTVLKADLIAGLRKWDRENPDALKDDDED